MLKYYSAALFLLLLISCQKKTSSLSAKQHKFEAIGHRGGYSFRYPENTLLSLEEAFKRGVKYCEIDIDATDDNIYVLFHDQPTMYRTSNGVGYIAHIEYNIIENWDFGSWKGSQFKGTKIPTLEEALLLAEKYDAHLYLDTKELKPALLAKALKDTKVNPNRFLPSIYSLEEAKEFRKYCPKSPWVWFGGIPKKVNDENWYKKIKELGCNIYEIYYGKVLDNSIRVQVFKKRIHDIGGKLWVFTSNNQAEIKQLIALGIDGLETDIPREVQLFVDNGKPIKNFPQHRTTANYTFDNQKLLSTGVGSQIRDFGYSNTDELQKVKFGTTALFDISNIDNEVANVIKIPAYDPINGLMLFDNFAPNIDPNLHYNYTLIFDLLLPGTGSHGFISLFQTSPENENDADLFINADDKIGVGKEYFGSIQRNKWYRIAIAVSQKSINIYIDGKFVGKINIKGGRWAVYNNFAGGQDQGFLLFADNDNETSEMYISAIQLRNYTMNNSEIAYLGKPNYIGIPINNTGIYFVDLESDKKYKTIVNWNDKTIDVFIKKEDIGKKVKLTFKLPFGAKSSIKSGSYINLSTNNTDITVTAQDGITKTDWQLRGTIE